MTLSMYGLATLDIRVNQSFLHCNKILFVLFMILVSEILGKSNFGPPI